MALAELSKQKGDQAGPGGGGVKKEAKREARAVVDLLMEVTLHVQRKIDDLSIVCVRVHTEEAGGKERPVSRL